jgi:hypothetical protein
MKLSNRYRMTKAIWREESVVDTWLAETRLGSELHLYKQNLVFEAFGHSQEAAVHCYGGDILLFHAKLSSRVDMEAKELA